MKYSIFSFLLLSFFLAPAQEVLTKADYKRAESFSTSNMRKKIFDFYVNPNWLDDNSGFWYSANSLEGKKYWRVDINEFTREEAFDHQKMTKLLRDSLRLNVKPKELPLRNLEFWAEGKIKFQIGEQKYVANLERNTIEEFHEPIPFDPPGTPVSSFGSNSPDGKWYAFVRDYNLFIKSIETGEETQLSTEGKKNYEYASYYRWDDIIEGENGERAKRFFVNWSPDSKMIFANIIDLRKGDKMFLLDWSVDSLYRPRLLSYYRASPGDTNVVYVIPVLFDVEAKKEIRIDLKPGAHFKPAYFDWMDGGKKLLANRWERGYKKMEFLTVDLETGKTTPKFTQESETNVDNSSFTYRYTDDGKTLFFLSEKSGWNHLYRLNLENGELKQLTEGEYFVRDIVKLDELNGCIYFNANGQNKKRNIYHSSFYRINLDGSKLKLLTPEVGNHDIRLSPDGEYFLDNYSAHNQPVKSVLRNLKNGKTVMDISEADISRLKKTGWDFPESFSTIARDGKTEIYGVIWKPSNFDPTKSYPIIDYSYTGPHTNVFPTTFSRAVNGRLQSIAELGFIVMSVDGLGSAKRSKAFHNWSYKQMGENLTDHILAIRHLGKQYSWIDTTRVGIFGHSAGGYDAAHALLRFPDFYKVGVASSADHDHRMEKAWWPEMYLGWPVDSAYHQQSNITMAGNLKGKLLITHGGIDENVNPSATFKLADALIKAGKDFDMLILPSQRHGYRGVYNEFFEKKRMNYFVEHLLGVKPIWD